MTEDQNSHLEQNAERVRAHRKIRREAGMIEIRVWVCEEDRGKVQKVLLPFTVKADHKIKTLRYQNYKEKTEAEQQDDH